MRPSANWGLSDSHLSKGVPQVDVAAALRRHVAR